MNTITIPPAALEAGARAAYETPVPGCSGAGFPAWEQASEPMKDYYRMEARAAFEAMVENWEGAQRVKGYFTHDTDYYEPAFILPLMENGNG